jgi:hypothetical protein
LVPGISIRLLCPRHIAKTTQCEGDGFNSTSPTGTFTCQGHKIMVAYHQLTGLPMIQTAPGVSSYISYITAPTACLSLPTSSKLPVPPHPMQHNNLSPAQRVKLILHEWCNHVNMPQLNAWIWNKHFAVDPSIANAADPICKACQFGKAKRKPHITDTGQISRKRTYPGAGVSADQMEAGYPGKMFYIRGLPSTLCYKYCNFWVDNYSKYEASKIMKSKQCFEDFARHFNASIKSIRADNGVYASTIFQQTCTDNNQNLTFCSIGSH